jgi:protein O-mannosyl-transferase
MMSALRMLANEITTENAGVPFRFQAGRHWSGAPFAVALVVFAVFSPVLLADFVAWDDDLALYQNPHLKGLNAETLRWMFADLRYVWRYAPFTWLAWQGIYQVQGLAPLGYHLASVLVHSLNAAWLFLLIRKLLPLALPRECQAAPAAWRWACPALGALLWALHPLRVEPVAWAAGYLHCQSLCFMLLCLWLYLESATAVSRARRRWCYSLSVLAHLVSLFSFPSSLGLVPLLIVLDFYPLRRFPKHPGGWWSTTTRRIWLEKTPFAALALLAAGIGVLTRLDPRPGWLEPASLDQFGLLARLAQACYVGVWFLWKPWAPFGLCPVYTTLIQFNPMTWPFVLSMGSMAGLTAVLVWKWRAWPWALALWAGHWFLLFPMLGFTEHPHFPSDRYSYGAGVLWSMLAAGLLLKLWPRRRARLVGVSIFLALAAVWGLLSVRQARVWHNSEALFRYAIANLGADPYCEELHRRLGAYYHQRGRLEEALAQYQAALHINPGSVELHNDLGVTLHKQGKVGEAAREFEEVLRLDPSHAQAHNNRGLVLANQGEAAAAKTEFLEALRLKPDYPDAHGNLGKLLAEQGSLAEAEAQASEVLRLQPDNPGAHQVLASIYKAQSRFAEARAQYEASLRLAPDWPEVLNNLAWLLATQPRAELRDGPHAVTLAQRACQLTGSTNLWMLSTLAAAYAEAGRFPEAVNTQQKVCELAAAQGQAGDRFQRRLELYRSQKPCHEP